jgi:hypothetical protein
MARQKATEQVIPSARRLIHSLRDVGYGFVQAVADIVDNSIAAHASIVAIDMRFDGGESWLRIADNGKGMSATTIKEAMRFGTERDYESDELGKFGLGLKTASLSQSSRLTVASRADRSARRIEVRQWDLAHVESTNRWEIINIPPDERSDILIESLQDTTGTVVLWEKLDRMLGYKIPWGDRAKNSFLRFADELDQHLGMVFHRFLTGEARRRKKLQITINGTRVEPWDPFARDEKSTIGLPEMQFEIVGSGGLGLVAYRPYILPPQDRFSSLKAFNRCAGPGKWNYQQGFYIYRADRMIQSGGWSYMRTSDEHTKLARAALDFWPDLDSAFDLNVAKARVNLPEDLRTKLKPHIEQLVKQARKIYSPSSCESVHTPLTKESTIVGRESQNENIDAPATGLSKPRVNSHLGRALERAADKAGEVKALGKIKKTLRMDDPDAADEIGW